MGAPPSVHSMRNLKVTKQGALDTSFSIPVLTQILGKSPCHRGNEHRGLRGNRPSPPSACSTWLRAMRISTFLMTTGILPSPTKLPSGLKVNAGVTLLLNSNHGVYDLGMGRYGRGTGVLQAYPHLSPVFRLRRSGQRDHHDQARTRGRMLWTELQRLSLLETGRYFVVAQTGVIDLRVTRAAPSRSTAATAACLISMRICRRAERVSSTPPAAKAQHGEAMRASSRSPAIWPAYTCPIPACSRPSAEKARAEATAARFILRNDGYDIYSAGTISTMEDTPCGVTPATAARSRSPWAMTPQPGTSSFPATSTQPAAPVTNGEKAVTEAA